MIQKILMRIDFQNDFVHENGALSLQNANLIHKHQNFANSDFINQFDKIIDTYDTHFTDTYPSTQEAKKYPIHCVYGTWGWQQAAPFPKNTKVIPMYKATTNIWNEQNQYRDLQNDWSNKIVFLCGVLSDVCVQQALDGLLQHHAYVVIIEDLCQGATYQINDIFQDHKYKEFIQQGHLRKINSNILLHTVCKQNRPLPTNEIQKAKGE